MWVVCSFVTKIRHTFKLYNKSLLYWQYVINVFLDIQEWSKHFVLEIASLKLHPKIISRSKLKTKQYIYRERSRREYDKKNEMNKNRDLKKNPR